MNLPPQNAAQRFKGKSSPLLCRICGKPVAVEISKADEDGRAIHEDCYAMKIKLDQASKDGCQT